MHVRHAATLALTLFLLLPEVASLGCMPAICDGNPKNDLRDCPDSDRTCGHYHGRRKGGRIVNGVDIKCRANSVVHAPFDGDMYFWRPFGGNKDYKCADQGVRIEGTGQWQGYYALIASVALDSFGGKVKQGAPIGKAIAQSCSEKMGGDFQEFVQMRLYRQGKLVDPTFHLKNCMCTGQICESNPTNKLEGQPFKPDSRYNGVRGWDILCPKVDDSEGNSLDSSEERAPWIYSPIDGQAIGRLRLRVDENSKYSGCDNDGIFITGTGAWQDYEVRIYNVQFRSDIGLGRQSIVQGQQIARRLTCDNAPDSIFLEMRYRGQVVDISSAIAAEKCQQPDVPLLK